MDIEVILTFVNALMGVLKGLFGSIGIDALLG